MVMLTVECKHPSYSSCTLVVNGDDGLAIIQQRLHDENTRSTIWTAIDSEYVEAIRTSDGFDKWFRMKSAVRQNDGFFPAYTLRQVLHALHLQSPPKEPWETRW